MQEKLIWVDYIGLLELLIGTVLLIYVLAFREKVKMRKSKREFYGDILFSIALVLIGVITYFRISNLLDLTFYAILLNFVFYTTVVLYFVLVRWSLREK